MTKVTINGQIFDIDAVRVLMDDEIAEKIHLSVSSEQEFVDAYMAAHMEKYGEEFTIN